MNREKEEARHGIRTLYSLCFETAEQLDFHLFTAALPTHNVITYQMMVPCAINLSRRKRPSSKILHTPNLCRSDHRLSAARHDVLRNQPLEKGATRRRAEERGHAHADREILEVVLAHDHHEAKHAMDTNAVDGHRGSIPEALHDGVIVLDVKSIAISDENSVPVPLGQRREQNANAVVCNADDAGQVRCRREALAVAYADVNALERPLDRVVFNPHIRSIPPADGDPLGGNSGILRSRDPGEPLAEGR